MAGEEGFVGQILALNHPTDADLLSNAVAQCLNVAGREDLLSDPAASIQSWFD